MITYVAFGVAPSMFPSTCTIAKQRISSDRAKQLLQEEVVSCVNPSHTATLVALIVRFRIEYTDEEIARAAFDFSLWTVRAEA